MMEIRVNVPKAYTVYIGKGMLESSADILQGCGINGKIVTVCDSNVAPLYLERFESILRKKGFETSHFIFQAGEKSKNVHTLSDILEAFAEIGITRNDTAVALGGGVTGDITGFAAGVYMRGISYVQIPTTLLSCVDSSVGGKTAVDLNNGKNLAGLFIQPKAVICDTELLSTLSEEYYADGMAEVIKTAILGDTELFERLETAEPRSIDEYIISRCVAYKGNVVTEDEFEMGVRKLLNLGHTPAHSVEKLSGYTVPHGHAVAMGLGIMTRSAKAEGLIDEETENRILSLLEKYSLPTNSSYSARELADTAFFDKKRQGNNISIIKIKAIGDCVIEKIPSSELQGVFERGMNK